MSRTLLNTTQSLFLSTGLTQQYCTVGYVKIIVSILLKTQHENFVENVNVFRKITYPHMKMRLFESDLPTDVCTICVPPYYTLHMNLMTVTHVGRRFPWLKKRKQDWNSCKQKSRPRWVKLCWLWSGRTWAEEEALVANHGPLHNTHNDAGIIVHHLVLPGPTCL